MSGKPVSLPRSLTIQCRVIGAILMREIITRYGRHNIGVLWLIVEPMLFVGGISTLWYVGNLHSFTNIPVFAFAITGYAATFLWRNATNRCSKAIEPNIGLLYHRNVKVIDIFASRTLLELIGGTASFFILTVTLAAVGLMQWPQNVILLLAGWLLQAWFAFALGCIVGVFSERSKFFERIWGVVNLLLFPVSGALFMVHWIPPSLQDIVLLLPMVHGVEMIRHGYFGQLAPTHENPMYFVVANMLLTLVGLALVRASERRVQVT